MAFFACGTRDKLNAQPVGATRHFVDGGSLFGTGLIFSRCKALLVLMGLGHLSFEGSFWDMPEKLPLSSRVGREVLPGTLGTSLSAGLAEKLGCGEPVADMGRRDSASACRRPRPAASLRSLRAALENASRFLSSAPLRVRIPPHAHEKALQVHKSLERYVLWGWDGGIRTPNSRHQKPEFYR